MSDTMSTKTKKKTTSKKNEVPTEDEVVPMEVVDEEVPEVKIEDLPGCLLYTSPSPRDVP